MNNPFILSFGREPLNFIPRTDYIQEIISEFYSDTHPNQTYMITGVRGSGKTVFLSKIAKTFKNEKHWVVVDLNPERDMLLSLASQLYSQGNVKHLFLNPELSVSFNGIGFSVENKKPQDDIEDVIVKIVDYLSKKKIRVLITVDDVANNKYIKVFAHTFQRLIRENYEVFLLMSGLYENINSVQNNKSLTFLLRVPKLYLKPLNMPAIKESYKKILDLDDEVAIELSRLTRGYAYAYQVLGNLMWDNKEKKITEDVINQFDQYLAEYVYDKLWDGLSEKEKEIANIMCETNEVAIILDESGLKDKEFSVYRDRMIKHGIIYSPRRGALTFVLPRFKDYILNKQLYDLGYV